MSKPYKKLLLLIITIAGMFLINITTVNATSWMKLTPEEVNRRAEVIVLGRYDFSSFENTEMYNSIYYPVKFKASKYYKGSGTEQISTGIDMMDLGSYKKQQNDGAEFLLFLERAKENNSVLIPIAGPNGIIEVLNGKVVYRDASDAAFYSELLNTSFTEPVKDYTKMKEAIVIGFAVLITALIIILRKSGIWQTNE